MKGGPQTRFQSAVKGMARRLRQSKGADVAQDAHGFSIVEVLIVLAVTGALFISAVSLISGRQNKTQFSTSINEMKSQLQQVISDVQTGFYPSSNSLVCQVNGAGNVTFSDGTTTQGSNKDCMFMGKVIQFGVNSTDPQQFIVYSIAGKRQTTAGADVKSYADALPVVMTTNNANPVDTPTIVDTLQYGLKIVPGSLTYTKDGTTAQIGALGFMSTLADFDADRSGSQQVQLLPVVGSALDATPAQAVTSINTNLKNSPVTPNGGVSMCFQSGTTNQSGLIKIGGNGRELSVTLSIKENQTCQ